MTEDYEAFAQTIQDNETITLVQTITNDLLFHKCLIKKRIKYSQKIINDSKKNTLGKHNLEKREGKYAQIFQHFRSDNNDLVQRQMWRDF